MSCPTCKGTGTIWITPEGMVSCVNPISAPCPACHGEGPGRPVDISREPFPPPRDTPCRGVHQWVADGREPDKGAWCCQCGAKRGEGPGRAQEAK
jgi:hypothetical protein